MNNIRKITDSSCDLNKDIIEKYNIKVVPLNVSFGDEIYMDSELDNKEFYEKMKNSKELPKTSCPSPERFINSYEGDEDVIVLTISSKLSGTYSAALLAKNMMLEENPNKKIEVKFRFNDEYISLTYDKESEVCILDRNNMELGGRGIRKFKLKGDKSLKLHMFIDNSVMEIYYQDGLETTTLMYFPKFNDFKLEIKNDNKLKINRLNIWSLKGIKYE